MSCQLIHKRPRSRFRHDTPWPASLWVQRCPGQRRARVVARIVPPGGLVYRVSARVQGAVVHRHIVVRRAEVRTASM